MKKDQVQIGQTYNAKITDKVVPVRIDAEHKSGGWHGTNMTTNRKVHIKSAQRLRNRVTVPGADEDKTAPTSGGPVKKKLTTAERRARVNQAKAKTDKPAATTQTPKAPKEKKLSLVAAAAQVLAKSKEPMNCKAMVDQVVAAGLWTPGTGKTPHATLYSAILRDLKADTPRFQKVDRGQFTLAKGA